jgi:hypothetical protein
MGDGPGHDRQARASRPGARGRTMSALVSPFDHLRPGLRPTGGTAKGRLPTAPLPPVDGPGEHPPPTPEHLLAVTRSVTRLVLVDPSPVTETPLLDVESLLADDVVTWSPALHTGSRTALLAALADGDDAVTDVQLTVVGEAVVGTTAYVEWQLCGRFDNAGFVNDDILVEPSCAPVVCPGVLVLTFVRGQVALIRCYYDALSLVEQVLPAEGRLDLRRGPSAG